MRIPVLATAVLTFAVSATATEHDGKIYTWVDENGVTHYDDSIPAEYTDLDKEVVSDVGITLEELEGRKTAEELAAERVAEEARLRKEMQLRADKALLSTYLSVDEIEMHRDRRVELFKAQSRVTELYLRNLQRELNKLEREASRYAPYSDDPDAQIIDPTLISAINETKGTIDRHQGNLVKFQDEEQVIMARFQGDITRFKYLKGID